MGTAKQAFVHTERIKAHDFSEDKAKPSAEHFVARIKSAWQKSVASIFEAGRVLLEAKATLRRGEFLMMIDDSLPFGHRTAQMLMSIAAHPILSNTKFVSCLPPSWGTLYELTQLPDKELEHALTFQKINPQSQRSDIKKLGLSLSDQMPKALRVLIHFMRNWPKLDKLADEIVNDEFGNWPHDDLDDIAELPAWITELHAACLRKKEGGDDARG